MVKTVWTMVLGDPTNPWILLSESGYKVDLPLPTTTNPPARFKTRLTAVRPIALR